jgi:predicted AlkP superfamily phosphohydrolase/phosphomutase
VLILGLDGVDPGLLRRWMKEGKLPHLARLASGGSYAPLATSIPPESPVAWSNFATGLNPGGHGIFDFIHRDPANMALRLSTSVTQEGGPAIRLGHWRIPLTSGEVAASRRGAAFWEIAEQAGVPCTIVRIPANYPPSDCSARQLAGMGTPDMEGGYGSFSFYSDEPEGSYGRVSGGKVLHVTVVDNRVDARLLGPVNSLRTDSPQVGIDFRVFVDADNPVAEIEIQDHRILLRQGEWSDWTRLRFPLLPWIYDVSGICRFYLKEVRPDFKLYVSPINIDPADPALPISTPERYSRELAQVLGPFHTLGIPEDTKALSAGVFSPHEFLRQSTAVWEETLRLFEYELRRFREGLLLFYFGRADQLQHMFWRDLEAQTPARPDAGVSVIEGVYRDLDGVVGQALAACDSRTTLIVLSDHGFGPFRRAFNLNNWLESNGFLRRRQQHQEGYLQDVDWSGTRAYGLGFAGLYLNLQGRERWGATAPVDAERLLDEITNRLLALRDPASGEAVVAAVHRSRSVYSGDSACRGPDLVIGYNRGFRAAWEGVLGMFSPEVLSDNSDAWSGDHLGEASLLPGVLLINRRIQVPDPTLLDLAPTILAQFQIRPGPGMKGRVLFSPNAVH